MAPVTYVHAYVLALEPLPEAESDPLAGEALALDLTVFATLADDFVVLAHHGRIRGPAAFVAFRNACWFDADDGVRATEALLGAVKNVRLLQAALFRPDAVKDEVVLALERCRAMLTRASDAHRRFRFEPEERPLSMDRQLEVLASAGIVPRDGTTREELTFNYPEEEWAERPWRCLADFIGASDRIADITWRCVGLEYGPDGYASLAASVSRLALGKLPLENVESLTDFDAETAFLAFDLDGSRHRIDFEWDDRGWVDMRIYTELDRLLRARAPGFGLYRMAYGPSASIVIMCLDDEGFRRLRAAEVPVALIVA